MGRGISSLGPTYRPFTRELEAHHEDVRFGDLYGMLLNEETQLKRDEALNVIAPLAQYTQSYVPTTRGRGRGRGRGGRGRGHFSNHGFTQSSHNSNFQCYTLLTQSGVQSSYYDMFGIVCHNCEGKGHIARVCPSPKFNRGIRVSRQPSSNLASTSTQPTQKWLMDSGTTHHLTTDLDNLAIHSEYQGPEEVTLDNILHVPTATQNLLLSRSRGTPKI
ncbi:hypothetical protein KY290_036762 [Solanum tuberosum]|uniref:CCHC-type domain-containing protein n=1 Tax=Solanum tuberosum TaxID=4113 RepID=A0ABQ7TTN5_SOLTU|nr:hypothetical protein KY285_036081 [Solanum tuberosum]KAH0738057.1 hypothetical protein KY290_036762 [Solanum tuberosum]